MVFEQEHLVVPPRMAGAPPRMLLRTLKRRKFAALIEPLLKFYLQNLPQFVELAQTVGLEEHERRLIEEWQNPEAHKSFCSLAIGMLLTSYIVLNPMKVAISEVPGNMVCLDLESIPSFLIQHLNYVSVSTNDFYFQFTEYVDSLFAFRNVFEVPVQPMF